MFCFLVFGACDVYFYCANCSTIQIKENLDLRGLLQSQRDKIPTDKKDDLGFYRRSRSETLSLPPPCLFCLCLTGLRLHLRLLSAAVSVCFKTHTCCSVPFFLLSSPGSKTGFVKTGIRAYSGVLKCGYDVYTHKKGLLPYVKFFPQGCKILD